MDGLEEEPAEVEYDAAIDSSEDDEQERDEDKDEAQIQANIAASKKFPLAHRCLESSGFRNGSLLESVLTGPSEVSSLTQKHEGMGLSMGYQLATVLHSATSAERLSVVSGTSKEGLWK